MKKTFMTCLAVAALFAIASSATAITCTLDQRPGATLLVPYFQVSIDPATGDVVGSGDLSRDTILTIGNASSAPMIAHVNVYDRFSNIVLDFNVALTGFDVQSMAMSQIITGHLPVTLNSSGDDVCQRAGGAVYPSSDGFLRVSPTGPTNVPATNQDNINGTTNYSGTFFSVTEALATDCNDNVEPLAIGYIVVDHANYCNLSDPTDPNYFIADAIGMENNLFGEIIYTSGNGLPTYGISTVNLEADTTLGAATEIWAGRRRGRAHVLRPLPRPLERDGLHQLRIRQRRHRPLDLRSVGRGLRRPARAPRPPLGRPLVRPDLLGHHHDQLHGVARFHVVQRQLRR